MTHDLLVFGEDWGGLPSSTQHLVAKLAHDHKTVWINSIGLRRPRICLHDLKRIWHKLTAGHHVGDNKTELPNEDFYVVNPRTIPAPHYKLERKLASELIAAQVKPVIKNSELRSPILWTSLPTAVDVADNIDHSALVYYCGDDFSSLAGVDHRTIQQHEQKLVEKADLIIAASDELAFQFPDEKTRVLPHGVDYPLFSTPTKRANDLVDDGRPIAGFYGSISEWLDLGLLAAAAARLPNWHFVFIGKSVVDISTLEKLENVRFLGDREHEALPGYVQHWTASLLPFTDNQQIQHCNPLKLREYIAAGRPVISTPFPALSPYKDLVTTVNNVDDLVEALIQSVNKKTSCRQQLAVMNQSWSSQADKVSKWLDML
jgi:glycosyltransferase involved in cell wall biosynthesis